MKNGILGCNIMDDISLNITADNNNGLVDAFDYDGYYYYYQGNAEGSLESSTIESTASKEAEEEDFIWVFVCGAVESPQVVKLPVGSRAMVAVKMAGGMTEDADESFVNLAAILEDGEKLYIPTKEEAVSLSIQEEKESLVNINTAGTKELCTLLGIGESRAEDIIAYRETHGPFAAIEDIMKVPGIKENAFAKIKDAITVK